MRNERNIWRADRGTRATKRLGEIEASIATLDDEDLLDLADIFDGKTRTPLGDIASAEMTKRGIGL